MFTPEEKALLSKYVTSTESNVYAVKGMEGMVGAAYARYSRAKGGFRETLLKEFIREGVVDPVHAAELIERILIAYGDDSVGELEGAHVSFEKVSWVAEKSVVDHRIGGAYIVQSTRYVLYDEKDEQGHWQYYRGPELLAAPFGAQYTETMDFCFETYARLVEPLKTFLEAQKPIGEAEYDINGDGVKEKLADLTDERQIKDFRRTYTFDLRAKACDILRYLLPISALANIGVFGNGRFYQNMISAMLTSSVPEDHALARAATEALGEVIPVYIRRAKRSEYLVNIRNRMQQMAANVRVPDRARVSSPEYHLHDEAGLVQELVSAGSSVRAAMEEARDIATAAQMLYSYLESPLEDVVSAVRAMAPETRMLVVKEYMGTRTTRRDRPGRALEDGYPYTFDMLTDFGVYKDLQRHRMSTQQRQLFTTRHGYVAPEELVSLGKESEVLACVRKSEALYEVMYSHSPELAQYAVLHGHLVRWTIGLNDRSAMHMFELRSTPQGHPNYRKAAQAMHRLLEAHSGWRAQAMNFVDHNDYYWSRADSEAKQRAKEAALEHKNNHESN
jgi:thymidylate synthase ThyX